MLDSFQVNTFNSRGEELCLYLYFVFVKVQNLSFLTFCSWFFPSVTFYDLDNNIHSRFVTSDDLLWPRADCIRKQVKIVILISNLSCINKVRNLTFLTSGDLCCLVTLFWKADVKSIILTLNLPTYNKFWNLTYFRNFWPGVTFVDLVTLFFEKLTSRASFWYTIYPLAMTFEIWPIFGIFDLGWPLLTSWPLFLKSWRQERHFDIQFTTLQRLLKFDPKWPQIFNLTPNLNFFFWK